MRRRPIATLVGSEPPRGAPGRATRPQLPRDVSVRARRRRCPAPLGRNDGCSPARERTTGVATPAEGPATVGSSPRRDLGARPPLRGDPVRRRDGAVLASKSCRRGAATQRPPHPRIRRSVPGPPNGRTLIPRGQPVERGRRHGRTPRRSNGQHHIWRRRFFSRARFVTDTM